MKTIVIKRFDCCPERYAQLPRSYCQPISDGRLYRKARVLVTRLKRLDSGFRLVFKVNELLQLEHSASGKYKFNPMFFGINPSELAPGDTVEIRGLR